MPGCYTRSVSEAALPVLFRNAQKQAEAYPDILSWKAWNQFEHDRREGEPMPEWWTDARERRWEYIRYVDARVKMLAANATINQGTAGFGRRFFGAFFGGKR